MSVASAHGSGRRTKGRLVRLGLAAAVLGSLMACGDGEPTALELSGSYTGSLSMSLLNAFESASGNSPIDVTLNSPDAAGGFDGSYQFPAGGGSGVLSGTVRSSGGVTVKEFGEPGVSPGTSVEYLKSVFHWCNFGGATSSDFSGNLIDNRLQVDGTISVPCYYASGGTGVRTLTTTITIEMRVRR